MKQKALFLDRDGVINERADQGNYIFIKDDFKLRRGIIELIVRARCMGYMVVVITNQRGVSRGLYTQADLDALHAHMQEELSRHGASVDAIYVCTHGFDECDCRKPKPGMLLRAAEDLHIDLASSIMVGDMPSDIEAGKSAGCATYLLVL